MQTDLFKNSKYAILIIVCNVKQMLIKLDSFQKNNMCNCSKNSQPSIYYVSFYLIKIYFVFLLRYLFQYFNIFKQIYMQKNISMQMTNYTSVNIQNNFL